MVKSRVMIATIGLIVLVATTGYCQNLEEQWNDFLHYTAIGRLDLAKGFAEAILESNPDPVELHELSQANPAGYAILLRLNINSEQLTPVTSQLLDLIEQGRFAKRTEPKIITAEIKRLSSTVRGRLTALERLKNAGEYAIPYMLEAMADTASKDELPNIIWALGRLDRTAIRPLVAGLQTDDIAVRTEIVRALGTIGYPQSLAYLKYIAENDPANEIRQQAINSIKQIDPAAEQTSAAELFFQLGQSYYDRLESLEPAADYDFANVWFWDKQSSR